MAFDSARLAEWEPRALALLRIVTGFLILQHGTAKHFGVPHVAMFDNVTLFSLLGFAGVLEASRTGGATNNYGFMYEFDAIAACFVGGVSTTGGIGTIPGVLAGVFIFGVINYGFTFIGINTYWQYILKGIVIVLAVAFDMRKYISRK
jgi:methyl-galactoside transport system permease protein